MTKTALLASAAALALSAGNALAGAPSAVGHGMPHRVIGTPGTTTLYDQTSNELSSALSSQNFGSGYSQYDSAGADDFTVPAGAKWKVKEVDVPGVNYGGSPAASLDVTFYKSKSGAPGAVKSACAGESNSGYNGTGGYAIKLAASTCTNGVLPKLTGGTGGKSYWVSVVANQYFGTDSQWFWGLNGKAFGKPGMWENPNGGFGLCPTWCDNSTLGYSDDYAFTLKGVSR